MNPSLIRIKSKLIRLRRWSIDPAYYILELFSSTLSCLGSGERRRTLRVALVSDGDASSSEEQFNPFSACRSRLRRELRLVSLELRLRDVLRAPKLFLSSFDVVVLKLSFRLPRADAVRVVNKIRSAVSDRRIIYFDGDDDACIQWPEILPKVNLYVKKHVFRDRNAYFTKFVGKSNLTNFVHEEFDYSFSDDAVAAESGPIPIDQLRKIFLGFNLALDKPILRLHRATKSKPLVGSKVNDIVFRGSVPDNWMRYLRMNVEPILGRLQNSYRVILPKERVGREEYYREMSDSKICVSPFGYGEICWRDFEAILCGCLIIKPDMNHIETTPDIFRPYRTYVPVRWDYSDLEEKCSYYLANDAERERIAKAAFDVLDGFYRNNEVIKIMADIFCIDYDGGIG
jgi:Glycosyl transferases group 1